MMYTTKEIDNDNIELEIVAADGRPVIRHPIDINDLYAHRGSAIDYGNGVHLQMDEEGGNSSTQEFLEYSEEYEEEDEEEEIESVSSVSEGEEHVPAGYRKLSDWYDALHAARLQRQKTDRRLNSIGVDAASDHKLSRAEVWASFSPPLDRTRNYHRLQCASLMPSAMSRRFWLPPLMYHATATYQSSTDQGQRVLLYGGTTNFGRTIESELYEFTLLSGCWRRLEGRQFVPPGSYGHTMAVVPSQQRLVVIGGIGPGGQPLSRDVLADAFCRRRFRFLFPRREDAMAALSAKAPQTDEGAPRITLCSLLQESEKQPTVGFVPVLFDMAIKTQRWRAVQTVHEMPVVLHTSVTMGEAIFVFGGVTNRLLVSAQLIRIDGESYVVSLLRPPGPSPKPRFLHSAIVYGNWIIIYGGFDVHNEPLDDAWAFDVCNERWECLDTVSPPARGAHAACVVGSRMLIAGGFEADFGGQHPPTSSVFELQLVPNDTGKHVWRKISLQPSIPPMAFATASSCGDDASFLLYGGCTVAPAKRKLVQPSTAQSRTYSSQRNSHRDGKGTKLVSQRAQFGSGLSEKEHEDVNKDDDADVWRHLVTYGDGHILTFPVKTLTANQNDGDGSAHLNTYSMETDPEEIPESFQAFVRRQQEFLLKKKATVSMTMQKTCLEEIENMEPHLYLTPEEIELLISSCEEFSESIDEFPIKSIPSNLPDRESHVHINEECVSLIRQIRDVLKSMKGSSPGVTVSSGKRHRKRTGEKFEDHSAKKPFRRALVMTLLRDISRHLHKVHRLNRALRTVEWAEKGAYVAAIGKMRGKSKEFGGTIKKVLEKYIEHRIDSLMAGVAKRKEEMRLAKEAEKKRHGKGLHRDGLDPQRGRLRQSLAKGKEGDTANQQLHPQRVRKQGERSRSRHRSKSMGAGYYKDESQVTIPLLPKQRDELSRLAVAVQCAAEAFGTHCRTTLSAPSTAKPPDAPLAPQLLPPGGESPSPPQVQPPPVSQVPLSDALAVPSEYACAPSSATDVPSAPITSNADALRQKAAELADLAKGRVADFVQGLNETSPTGDPDKFVLRLTMLRPLLECKERVTAFSARVSGIRANVRDADSTSGPPPDVEAERRCRRLAKGLTTLAQRVTMCFLTRAGAKSFADVPPAETKAEARPPMARPGRTARRAREPVNIGKGTITVRELSDTLEVAEDEEEKDLGTMVPQEQYQQKQPQQQQPHSSVAFTKIPVSSSFVDVPVIKASGEVAFPPSISITSDAAMALAPTLSSTGQANIGDVIVPSLKDTKTVPNTISAVSGVSGEVIGGTPPVHAPIGSIRLATGPTITSKEQPALFTQDTGRSSSSPHQMSEPLISMTSQQKMISLSPGCFRLGDVPQQIHPSPASAVSEAHNVDGEDDYFFFGRRSDPAYAPVPVAEPVFLPKQTMPAEPAVVPSVGKIKTSPHIGTTNPAPTSLSSYTRRPVTHSSVHRLHTSGAPPAVQTTTARPANVGGNSGMFRGKLTPGEALILQGRDRLRTVSSRR